MSSLLTMQSDLVACPFCGSNNLYIPHVEGTIIHPAYHVHCDNCGAQGPTCDKGLHVKDWNTRYLHTPVPAAGAQGRCTLQEHCRCRDHEPDVREICANWMKGGA